MLERARTVGNPSLAAIHPVEEMEAASSVVHALVERAAAGDVDAFRRLFDRYAERVHRYAAVRLARGDDAEDALQEVFLAVWRGLPGFEDRHDGAFPAWVFGIARNVVAGRVRRAIRTRTLPIEDAREGAVEFESMVVSRRVLVDALERLPEAQREVVLMRFVAGLRSREVAEALGRSEAAVVALQMRALERLRRDLGEAR